MTPQIRRSIIVGLAALPLAGCGTSSPATAAAAPFVYVANTKSNEISEYSAAASDSGALTALAPATVPSGPFPYGIAVNRQGTSAYAVDVGPTSAPANEVSQYTINPITGQLTPKSPATVATGKGPEAIAITPNGASAYVTDSGAISQYSINQTTGALAPKLPATVASASILGAIAVTPNGRYAYVATCSGCQETARKHSPTGATSTDTRSKSTGKPTVWEYRIDPKTGALSSKPVAIVAGGNGPNWMAISPDGKSAYVATLSSVWQYAINPRTGRLTPRTPATVATGAGTHNVVIAPNGKNAYVITVKNNRIEQYRINPRTGTLSPKPASTATTVLHPEAIALPPDGKSAYVTSENDGKISQYSINPTTGKIVPKSPATVPTKSGSFGLAITPGRSAT